MCLMKASPQVAGPDDRNPCAPVPTVSVILQAMSDAYYEKANGMRTMAERTAKRAAEELAREEKKVTRAENRRKDEEVRLAKQARQAKKAANIKKAEEAKQAKDARRVQHFKTVEEAKLKKEARMAAQMEHIEALAGEEPEVSAWLEVMKQQHKDREDLGTALYG